jgi:hypothetical protein
LHAFPRGWIDISTCNLGLSLLVLHELFSFDLFGALGLLHLRAKYAKNSYIGFLTGFRRRRKTRYGGGGGGGEGKKKKIIFL